MEYLPATIPDDVETSVAVLLHRAADVIGMGRQADDALAVALSDSNFTGSEREQLHTALEVRCDDIARRRHPGLAGTGLVAWVAWQIRLREPWPIVADAAVFAAQHEGIADRIIPGRWVVMPSDATAATSPVRL